MGGEQAPTTSCPFRSLVSRLSPVHRTICWLCVFVLPVGAAPRNFGRHKSRTHPDISRNQIPRSRCCLCTVHDGELAQGIFETAWNGPGKPWRFSTCSSLHLMEPVLFQWAVSHELTGAVHVRTEASVLAHCLALNGRQRVRALYVTPDSWLAISKTFWVKCKPVISCIWTRPSP